MYKLIVVALLINVAWCELGCPNMPAGVHKAEPSAETLKGCKQYSCNSCCTANDSTALGLMPLQSVERWNFTQCNNMNNVSTLSQACSETFSQIMCFYKCSPNLYPFFGTTTRSIPVCDWFCDKWFQACLHDLTCVVKKNWIKGFGARVDGVDQCRDGSVCRTFEEVYGDSRGMCDSLFGDVFTYEANSSQCVDPFTEEHNVEVVEYLFPGSETEVCEKEVYSNYTDAGKIVGIVFGVLGAIFVILALLALYRRHKNQDGKDVSKEKATAQELTTMNAPKTAPPTTVNLPKDDSSSGEE